MSTLINSHTIVAQWLMTAGTSLYTLCGARVWWPDLPDAVVFDNTSPGIAFRADSETPTSADEMLESHMMFECFGGSANPANAHAVYQALYARMQKASGTVAAGRLHTALFTRVRLATRTDKGWPLYAVEFDVTTHA